MTRLTSWIIVVAACLSPAFANAQSKVEIADTKGDHLDVLIDGKVATRYMYAYDKSTPERLAETYKPYLHVFDADGKTLITKGAGGEFTHHRGIFIGWNKIKVGDKVYDRWHMKGGEIVHQSFENVGVQGGIAAFTATNHWNDEAGKPFLIEQRTMVVSAPKTAIPGRLVINFTSKLTPVPGVGDITLDGDPEHAGIHYRPSDSVDRTKTVYVYAKENADPKKDVDYPWVGETYTLTDSGKTYSVVEMSHPSNPAGTRWSAYRNYGRFGAFPVATIKSGSSLTVKYRFVVADGEMPATDAIHASWQQFSGVKSDAPKATVLPADQPKPKADASSAKKPTTAVATSKPATSAPTTAPTTSPVAKKRPKTNRVGPDDAPIKFELPPPEPLSVEEALKTFKLPEGLKIEPVASEPMVEEPIAISFDAKGRMYVVEMRGYMLDVEANGEEDPSGRIKRLEDTDGDGKMDKATVFLEGLVMPRAVMAYRNGAIVGVPPELAYWEDTNDDGVADKKTVIATDYGTKGGQPEHMANSPMWALDNWIYSAGYETKFREVRGQWVSAPTEKRGQWGLSQDDFGRFYFSTNSDVGRADPLPAEYFKRNPGYRARAGQNVGLMTTQEVWPSHPTPGVNRGYEEGLLRADGTLSEATAAGGGAIYRADLLPSEYYGNLFTPEPSGNLIKRMLVSDAGGKLSATNAYEGKDFLTSTDERFRPVSMYTGPDGAIYVVDMYKGVLQHYYFVTHYLIKNIKMRDLEQPDHWGRIYRIVPDGKDAEMPKMPADTAGLVALLASPNGWVRDTAQRLIVEKNDRAAIPLLKKLAADGATPVARLQALWTLQGMNRLDEPTTVKALGDADAKVRATAVRLSEPLLVPATRPQVLPAILKLAGDPAPEVQLQLALSVGGIPEKPAEDMIAGFLVAGGADADTMRDAVISSLRGRELEFIERLLSHPKLAADSESVPPPSLTQTLTQLAGCVMNERRGARVAKLLELIGAEPDGSWRQVALLTGIAPKVDPNSGKPTGVGKLIYLPEQPEMMNRLMKSADTNVSSLTKLVDLRIAWPDKPDVPPPPKIVPLTPEQQAQFDAGKAVYTLTCAACHQPNGMGQEGLAPPLADSEWVTGSPERVVRIVLQGIKGPIMVNGAPYNLEMPGLSAMTDADVAAVLTYVRREWENNAAPIDEKTVSEIRDDTKSRADLWTAKELMGIK